MLYATLWVTASAYWAFNPHLEKANFLPRQEERDGNAGIERTSGQVRAAWGGARQTSGSHYGKEADRLQLTLLLPADWP